MNEPYSQPDETGHFGPYGGRFVAETLTSALDELESLYLEARKDLDFQAELAAHLKNFSGRPTPLYFAERLSEAIGLRLHFKREDLNHTGAHKINSTIGQALLAKRVGKRRVIAETGAGQHGVATATVAARFGFDCRVYMGSEDIERQSLNVYRMRLLGAEVVPVESGSRTLKDAMTEALRDWVTNVDDTYYIIGSAAGPHPYPMIVRDFQRVIGLEAREQFSERYGRLPDLLVACVGGGSNAIGLFHPFIEDAAVRMVGVEAGGEGLDTKRHSATLVAGREGVLHGAKSYLLSDEDGQVSPTHSISAGLDYPGVGPEHSLLKDLGRVEYDSVTDDEALDAFRRTNRLEGIMPALESSHAIGWVLREARNLAGREVLVNLSGRGDKDVHTVAKQDGIEI